MGHEAARSHTAVRALRSKSLLGAPGEISSEGYVRWSVLARGSIDTYMKRLSLVLQETRRIVALRTLHRAGGIGQKVPDATQSATHDTRFRSVSFPFADHMYSLMAILSRHAHRDCSFGGGTWAFNLALSSVVLTQHPRQPILSANAKLKTYPHMLFTPRSEFCG